jgi:hypothetical protein
MKQVAVMVLMLMNMQAPLTSFIEVVPHSSDGAL